MSFATGTSTTWPTKDTGDQKNSQYHFGVYPGGVVYTIGGNYPGGGAHYPVGTEGGYPGTAGKGCIPLLIKFVS
jgi:hypothetical protein